jgi:hypothetical protein
MGGWQHVSKVAVTQSKVKKGKIPQGTLDVIKGR